MAGYVFISYSRSDLKYVVLLARHFRNQEIELWMDDNLVPGTADWVKAIKHAIEGCAAFILIMTPNSENSQWVDREIDLAQELKKPILPLLLDGRPLLRVRNVQYEDVTGGRMPSSKFVSQVQDHVVAPVGGVDQPFVGTFNILTLGRSGSGKAVLLPVLYHQLMNIGRTIEGMAIHADITQGSKLEQGYLYIADPHEYWPAARVFRGVGSVDAEWATITLHCSLRAGAQIPLFDLALFDYPGELLGGDGAAGSGVHRLQQFLDEAHVLVLLIDGHRLLRYFDGRDPDYLSTNIVPMYRQAQGFGGPIHFVITKWDLLRRKGYKLDHVRERLANAPEALPLSEFFVGRANAHQWRGQTLGPARLIPMSALGNFAQLVQKLDGEEVMVKSPTEPITPENVELLLLATLPDIAHWTLANLATEERLSRKGRRWFRTVTNPSLDAGIDLGIHHLLGGSVSPAAVFAIGAVRATVENLALDGLDKGVQQILRTAKSAYGRYRSLTLDQIKTREEALYYVLRRMGEELREFDRNNPNSKI